MSVGYDADLVFLIDAHYRQALCILATQRISGKKFNLNTMKYEKKKGDAKD